MLALVSPLFSIFVYNELSLIKKHLLPIPTAEPIKGSSLGYNDNALVLFRHLTREGCQDVFTLVTSF